MNSFKYTQQETRSAGPRWVRGNCAFPLVHLGTPTPPATSLQGTDLERPTDKLRKLRTCMLSLKLTVRFAEARFFISANLQYMKVSPLGA